MDDGVGQTILCIKRYWCHKAKSIDLLHEKSTFIRQRGHVAFLSPSLWGGLGATYSVRLRLIGKPVVDFLLVITELFSLGAMVQALSANID